MFRFTRLATVVTAVALIGGSSLAGVAVAQRNAAQDERKTLEARIAALEALRTDLAGSKARLDGLGNEVNGLRQAVTSDGHSVKVSGEAYLPTNLNAIVVAFAVRPTRTGVGAAMNSASYLAGRVTNVVKAAGVSADDVRTVWDTGFSDYENRNRFTAQARVLATVRSISRLDKVTKAGLAVGKDVTVGYVTVSDESDTAALADAREEAIAEARAKALRYAQAAGRKLGALTSISEQVAPERAPAEPGGDEFSYRPTFIVVIDAVYALV